MDTWEHYRVFGAAWPDRDHVYWKYSCSGFHGFRDHCQDSEAPPERHGNYQAGKAQGAQVNPLYAAAVRWTSK